jgi:Uma2 family endonuclease
METIRARPKARIGQPVWDMAQLYPAQGYWDEEDYLALDGNRLIEFTDGVIEVLPMPTTSHQAIVVYLLTALLSFVRPRKLGEVLVAPLPVRMRKGKYREPDIVFMLAKNAHRVREQYWQSADLVMEVVSPDSESRRRDFRRKRGDYRRARIPEYWIVDPAKQEITVLQLKGSRYVTAQKAGRGDRAACVLLKGFEVEVDKVFKTKNQ